MSAASLCAICVIIDDEIEIYTENLCIKTTLEKQKNGLQIEFGLYIEVKVKEGMQSQTSRSGLYI